MGLREGLKPKGARHKVSIRIPLRWRVAKVTGWFRGRFGKTSPEDVTDFAKVLALMVVGIDPTNGEPNAKWKLSAQLQERLREAGGQLHDFTQARPNENEELFLDLWLVSYAFRTKRNSALKPETRDAFLYRVEDFCLTASDLASDKVTELLRLYRGRFAEYSTALPKTPFGKELRLCRDSHAQFVWKGDR